MSPVPVGGAGSFSADPTAPSGARIAGGEDETAPGSKNRRMETQARVASLEHMMG